MKEDFLRMENENLIMKELKKKVGKEIEKIVSKRHAMLNMSEENT